MKRAVVTGSTGFIGRHFVDRLVRDGFDVDCCDTDNPWPHATDCRDFFRASHTRYDLAVHAAAIVGGRAKIDGEPLAIADNLSIDSAAFQWAALTRPHRFVYFSSSAAYPVWLQTASLHRLSERDINMSRPEEPDSMYGWAKLTGERLATVARDAGVDVRVFRPFSGYGTTQSLDYPVPSFIARAVCHDNPFTIWGDGGQVRDWIHVDDIVNAVLASIDIPDPGPVNLCTGTGTSFNQLANMVCDHTPTIRHLLDAPVGVRYRVGDPTLLNTFYKPQVPLQEGVDRALHHHLLADR
jgi:nucleoside-diphosphate-sugar epimerase